MVCRHRRIDLALIKKGLRPLTTMPMCHVSGIDLALIKKGLRLLLGGILFNVLGA